MLRRSEEETLLHIDHGTWIPIVKSYLSKTGREKEANNLAKGYCSGSGILYAYFQLKKQLGEDNRGYEYIESLLRKIVAAKETINAASKNYVNTDIEKVFAWMVWLQTDRKIITMPHNAVDRLLLGDLSLEYEHQFTYTFTEEEFSSYLQKIMLYPNRIYYFCSVDHAVTAVSSESSRIYFDANEEFSQLKIDDIAKLASQIIKNTFFMVKNVSEFPISIGIFKPTNWHDATKVEYPTAEALLRGFLTKDKLDYSKNYSIASKAIKDGNLNVLMALETIYGEGFINWDESYEALISDALDYNRPDILAFLLEKPYKNKIVGLLHHLVTFNIILLNSLDVLAVILNKLKHLGVDETSTINKIIYQGIRQDKLTIMAFLLDHLFAKGPEVLSRYKECMLDTALANPSLETSRFVLSKLKIDPAVIHARKRMIKAKETEYVFEKFKSKGIKKGIKYGFKEIIEKGHDKAIKPYLKSLIAILKEKEVPGLNPNYKDDDGNPILCHILKSMKTMRQLKSSCWTLYMELVKLLLEKGADPNLKDEYDRPVLLSAVEVNDIQIMELFFQSKYPVAITQETIMQAMKATSRYQAGMKEFLKIKKNEYVFTKTIKKGIEYGFKKIIKKGHDEEIELYINPLIAILKKEEVLGLNPNFKDDAGNPILCHIFKSMKVMRQLKPSCCTLHMELVKLLLEKGADPNLKDKDDRTVFLLAVEMNDMSIIKLFFQNKYPVAITKETIMQAINATNQIEMIGFLKIAVSFLDIKSDLLQQAVTKDVLSRCDDIINYAYQGWSRSFDVNNGNYIMENLKRRILTEVSSSQSVSVTPSKQSLLQTAQAKSVTELVAKPTLKPVFKSTAKVMGQPIVKPGMNTTNSSSAKPTTSVKTPLPKTSTSGAEASSKTLNTTTTTTSKVKVEVKKMKNAPKSTGTVKPDKAIQTSKNNENAKRTINTNTTNNSQIKNNPTMKNVNLMQQPTKIPKPPTNYSRNKSIFSEKTQIPRLKTSLLEKKVSVSVKKKQT